MEKPVLKKNKISKWEPHPLMKEVLINVLLSHRDNQSDLTCMLVKVKKGAVIEAHTHETQYDIIYTIQGKYKMWIEGVGDFEIGPRDFIQVPKNTKHQPHDIEEDVLAFDIFYPFFI